MEGAGLHDYMMEVKPSPWSVLVLMIGVPEHSLCSIARHNHLEEL